ncbi:hypothetical protein ACH4VX_11800 [Streptomyces sp. NPDC020731]|uniref:hypothetical protein n=1 Tax=Streptomyces sp. NPDC020731 TaxID=3365085 RepID=UPI003799E692
MHRSPDSVSSFVRDDRGDDAEPAVEHGPDLVQRVLGGLRLDGRAARPGCAAP